jgi:hypothetical protein
MMTVIPQRLPTVTPALRAITQAQVITQVQAITLVEAITLVRRVMDGNNSSYFYIRIKY